MRGLCPRGDILEIHYSLWDEDGACSYRPFGDSDFTFVLLSRL